MFVNKYDKHALIAVYGGACTFETRTVGVMEQTINFPLVRENCRCVHRRKVMLPLGNCLSKHDFD
jgi:hypothetical protein